MYNPFTKHPHSVGETYLEHMWNALKVVFQLQIISLLIYVHAFLPFLFEHNGSDGLEKIHKELQKRRK